MARSMVELVTNMLNRWTALVNSGNLEINVERDISETIGEIIAKTCFGMNDQDGPKVFQKLKAMQVTLFKSNRFLGVPFSEFIHPKQLEAKRLGKEIDQLLLSIINARKETVNSENIPQYGDLLGLLLKASSDNERGNPLTTRELMDECKTFFFGGHDTTSLALTWTLLLLALHPEWQTRLREEIRQVVGDNKEVDFTTIAALEKVHSYLQIHAN